MSGTDDNSTLPTKRFFSSFVWALKRLLPQKPGRNLSAKLAPNDPKLASGEWKGNRINETWRGGDSFKSHRSLHSFY
jgi:hypothetical protein